MSGRLGEEGSLKGEKRRSAVFSETWQPWRLSEVFSGELHRRKNKSSVMGIEVGRWIIQDTQPQTHTCC